MFTSQDLNDLYAHFEGPTPKLKPSKASTRSSKSFVGSVFSSVRSAVSVMSFKSCKLAPYDQTAPLSNQPDAN